MANFDLAYRFMATHEWSQRRNYTNDPADPGGHTKWGITLASWRGQGSMGDLDGDGDVDADDLRMTTEDQAKIFYRVNYWIWEGIEDDVLAAKLFDLGVNTGLRTATFILQRALNLCGNLVVEDRKLGPKTVAAANDTDARDLLDRIARIQAQHYKDWIEQKPEREKFRRGLLARAGDVPEIVVNKTRNA